MRVLFYTHQPTFDTYCKLSLDTRLNRLANNKQYASDASTLLNRIASTIINSNMQYTWDGIRWGAPYLSSVRDACLG